MKLTSRYYVGKGVSPAGYDSNSVLTELVSA